MLRDVLADKLDKIKAIDDSILTLLDQIESGKELHDIITPDDKCRLTLTRLKHSLKKFNTESPVSNGYNYDVNVHLPNFTIKKFNGDVAN